MSGTVFVKLPPALCRAIDGGCQCHYCKAHPAKTPQWDTLAMREDGSGDSWPVHYPELKSTFVVSNG